MRLTIGSNNEQCFDDSILVQKGVFKKCDTIVCHNIMRLLFRCLVQETIDSNCKKYVTFFEYKIQEYITGVRFDILNHLYFPLPIFSN